MKLVVAAGVAVMFAPAAALSEAPDGLLRSTYAQEKAQSIRGSEDIRLVGWARLKGEFEIFERRPNTAVDPRDTTCISGSFPEQSNRAFQQFDGRKVSVIGRLLNYRDLPDEPRILIPRKMLGQALISNWCYGDKILLIKSMELAK